MMLMAVLAAAPAPLVVSRFVARPPDEVYRAFTTPQGLATFLAPQVRFTLAPGGPFEAYFNPDAPPGLRGGEGCVVKAWTEGKVFSFTWNFPPAIPSLRNANARTDVTVTFAAEKDGTRVTLTQSGWKDGDDWAAGRKYFERAWGFVLARLARSFTRGPIDWKHAWRPVRVHELAFLQGMWRGTADGHIVEETWVVDGDSGGFWARERLTPERRRRTACGRAPGGSPTSPRSVSCRRATSSTRCTSPCACWASASRTTRRTAPASCSRSSTRASRASSR
jgi:uncharacterized protein YndB with AHSA1/START domain